jgi:hypothetical protein
VADISAYPVSVLNSAAANVGTMDYSLDVVSPTQSSAGVKTADETNVNVAATDSEV